MTSNHTSLSAELKPCPFCGGAAAVRTYQDESLWSHDIVTKTQVGCDNCDYSFATEPGYEVEALDLWNARPAIQEQEPVGWPTVCKECSSKHLTWFTANTNPTGISQGRLSTSDVSCVFVLGCDECSETLVAVRADVIAEKMNASALAKEKERGHG